MPVPSHWAMQGSSSPTDAHQGHIAEAHLFCAAIAADLASAPVDGS